MIDLSKRKGKKVVTGIIVGIVVVAMVVGIVASALS